MLLPTILRGLRLRAHGTAVVHWVRPADSAFKTACATAVSMLNTCITCPNQAQAPAVFQSRGRKPLHATFKMTTHLLPLNIVEESLHG
jgi:hypothetical protein